MPNAAHKKPRAPVRDEIVTGLFSKKDAAVLIAGGCRHLHSSVLGVRDASVQLTRGSLDGGNIPTYPWELLAGATSFVLSSSADRFSVIREVAEKAGLKRELREKLQSVLEEMVTNAIYHPYMQKDGSAKYARHSTVKLADAEKISVRFQCNESGIYLSVTDQGGTFSFPAIASAFKRCYGSSGQQILQKESGAGLGMYMIFETVTHIKVVTHPHANTEISCWIADKKAFDPDHFSFNYFDGR